MGFSLFTTTVEQMLEDISLALIEPLVNTTLGSVVNLIGVNTVNPPSMVGIYPGAYLLVDTGSVQEQVIVRTVTANSFSAYFIYAHAANAVLAGATFPSGQTDHPLFTQNEVLSYLAEVQNEFLLKTRCIFGVTGTFSEPANLALVVQQRFYQQPLAAIRVERVARAIPKGSGGLKFTQLAADPFNRADENPLNPAAWTISPPVGALQIISNACVATNAVSGFAAETYTGISFPNDQWAQVKVLAADPAYSGDFFTIQLRATQAFLAVSGYTFLGSIQADGTLTLLIYSGQSVGGSFLVLWQQNSVLFSPGDVFTFGVIGTTLYLYQNGTLLTSVADPSNFATAGIVSIGMECSAIGSIQLTDFMAGSITVAQSQEEVMDLYETTQSNLDMENYTWSAESDIPKKWFRDQSNTSMFGVSPMPNVGGFLELWYSKRGPLGNQNAVLLDGTLLIPDVMAHYLKYGVLHRCWSKDGEARDPMRAEYCKKRFEMGVVVVQRFMEGIGLDTRAPQQGYSPMAVPRG